MDHRAVKSRAGQAREPNHLGQCSRAGGKSGPKPEAGGTSLPVCSHRVRDRLCASRPPEPLARVHAAQTLACTPSTGPVTAPPTCTHLPPAGQSPPVTPPAF